MSPADTLIAFGFLLCLAVALNEGRKKRRKRDPIAGWWKEKH